jgi:hypothetical protein
VCQMMMFCSSVLDEWKRRHKHNLLWVVLVFGVKTLSLTFVVVSGNDGFLVEIKPSLG